MVLVLLVLLAFTEVCNTLPQALAITQTQTESGVFAAALSWDTGGADQTHRYARSGRDRCFS